MLSSLERRGSSKDIYVVWDERAAVSYIRFEFSERVSVLDLGPIPNTPFPDLGRLRCAIAGRLFQEMNAAGFRTHYIRHSVEQASMDVLPFDIPDLDIEYPESNGRILGIEIIDRRKVTEKLINRVVSGQLEARRVAFFLGDKDLVAGARFSPAFVECTTKYEAADRYIDNFEAADYAQMSANWLIDNCYSEVRHASSFLSDFFERFGFE